MALNVTRNLEALGLDVETVTNENYKGITKKRMMDEKTNHAFIRIDSEAHYPKLKTLPNLANFDLVLISDYDKGFLDRELIEKISIEHPFTILDTKKILGEWAINCRHIKINDYEFTRSKENISSGLENKIIVTKGESGALYQGVQYPVDSVDVRDTSGAGDAFLAGLTFALSQDSSIEEAIKVANKFAQGVVQKRGVTLIEK